MKIMKKTAALLLAVLTLLLCAAPAFASAQTAAPKKPKGFKVAVREKNSITFEWTKDEGVTGFIIYRPKNGEYIKVGSTKKSSYTIDGLYSARKYNIGVKAYIKKNDKYYYSQLRTYAAYTRPCAPTFTVYAGPCKAVLDLKPAARADGYEVWYSAKEKSGYTLAASGNKMRFTVKELPASGTYYFKLRAYFTVDGKTYYSRYSKVKKVTDPTAAINAICKKYGADGVQVAVINNKREINTYCYGMADKAARRKVTSDTKYRVASLSKLMSNVVLMRLQEEGKIKTTANVEKYFGYRVRNPHYPKVPITARMLMTHTSSIIDSSTFNTYVGTGMVSLKTLLQSGSSYLYIKPGTFYSYSNFSGALVGAVCEKATGKTINTLAQKYVFDRMNINASYSVQSIKDPKKIGVCYNPGGYAGQDIPRLLKGNYNYTPGTQYYMAQGNLYISAKDYAKMIAALLNDGVLPDGTRLLEKKSVDEMLTNYHNTKNAGYGYGVWIKKNLLPGKTTYSHTGSSYGMYAGFAFCPETGQGIVVLTSGASGSWLESKEQYSVCYEIMKTVWGI